ncbi:hypothetical protein CWE22_05575 [Pseudidiomarina aestuarii]|uniref:Capsule biosynthesis GfcC-like N-terminal domain-containing protein n=1 Tax=Pseudidiomarina aestuarii TaxID=624146 RepID=A0A7Z6ZUM6_9GAMM|nr:YjbF family lipoprotein [Pseudidiomarina aestuarii]RUO41628.1 hypothetical protein CWE22_05575 [Pseudidiomarina aestuarii]
MKSTNKNNYIVSFVLSFLALSGLSACSSLAEDTSSAAPAKQEQEQDISANSTPAGIDGIVDYLFADEPELPVREVLQQYPMSTAYVTAGENSTAVMVLGPRSRYGDIWYVGPQALVFAHGRVIASGDVTPSDLITVTNLEADPLRCMQQASPQTCPREWQRSVDVRPSKVVNSNYQRGDGIVSYEVASTFSVQGDTVTEKGTATGALGNAYPFENSFTLSDGRVSQSRQWFSPQLGYLEYDIVKAPDMAAQVRYEAPAFAFSAPMGNRLSLLLENAIVAPRLSVEHYWPLLRIHNDSLQQKFEARKQGMLVRLRLLREYYNGEGQTELAAATQELVEAFQSWPLRATYQHGVQPPQMLIDFADNPYLNPADAGASGEYTVSIPQRPDAHRMVGLSESSAAAFSVPGIYDVQPNGSIQAHTALDPMLLPLPGHATLRLQSIPDTQLPPGFRDMNYQLALFLQHWDWAADAVADGGAQ